MQALTISQPFATLIAEGHKWVENRTWPTRYRGDLAIHAGKGQQYLNKNEIAKFPTGCVIAIARLAAVVELSWAMDQFEGGFDGRIEGSTKSVVDLVMHQHSEGPWCWILEDVRAIDPVPVRGSQGLWTWEQT